MRPAAAGEPGTVAAVDGDGVVVSAGRGAIRLVEVAPAGRRRMPAADCVGGPADPANAGGDPA